MTSKLEWTEVQGAITRYNLGVQQPHSHQQLPQNVEESEPDLNLVEPELPSTPSLQAFHSLDPPEKKICIWDFMTEVEINIMRGCTRKQCKLFIADKILRKTTTKGVPLHLLVELLVNVHSQCRKKDCNAQQTGAIMSMFFMTHLFFLKSAWTSADEVYNYFRDLAVIHSVAKPPESIRLFDHTESHIVLVHFCKSYMRNLPLIRVLCLPGYELMLTWEDRVVVPKIKSAKRSKKDSKKSSKKSSEKSSKKSSKKTLKEGSVKSSKSSTKTKKKKSK